MNKLIISAGYREDVLLCLYYYPLRAQHQAKLVMTFQARHVLVGHGLWLSEERSPCCGSLKKNEKSSSFGKLGIPPSPAG